MKHLQTYNESIRDKMTPKPSEDIIKILPLDDRIKEVLISKGFKYTDFNGIADFKNDYTDVNKQMYIFKKDDVISVIKPTDDVEETIKYLNTF